VFRGRRHGRGQGHGRAAKGQAQFSRRGA
jgi:hypothetical protein